MHYCALMLNLGCDRNTCGAAHLNVCTEWIQTVIEPVPEGSTCPYITIITLGTLYTLSQAHYIKFSLNQGEWGNSLSFVFSSLPAEPWTAQSNDLQSPEIYSIPIIPCYKHTETDHLG